MPHKGYKQSKKHREKTLETLVNFKKGFDKRRFGKGLFKDKNPAWRGGTSFEPYSIDWTETLRRSIRERDHYQCQMCGQSQGDRVLDVHHIDYDKKNCDSSNLVTLCRKCHMKTNHYKEKWIEYFSN